MPVSASGVARVHNYLIQTISDRLPDLWFETDRSLGIRQNNRPFLGLGVFPEINSNSTAVVKMLAPVALAAVAAYFCPVAGVTGLLGKGVVFLGTYIASLPVLGLLWSVAVRINYSVTNLLGENHRDGKILTAVKQLALPVIATVAVYYLFPAKLVFAFTLTRETAILAALPVSYVLFDKFVNRDPANYLSLVMRDFHAAAAIYHSVEDESPDGASGGGGLSATALSSGPIRVGAVGGGCATAPLLRPPVRLQHPHASGGGSYSAAGAAAGGAGDIDSPIVSQYAAATYSNDETLDEKAAEDMRAPAPPDYTGVLESNL
jgi:hypothetical protein